MTHDEMIEVIQAHKDGKIVQIKRNTDLTWSGKINPEVIHFNFVDYDYRVKPEPREFALVRDDVNNELRVTYPPLAGLYYEVIKVREVLE